MFDSINLESSEGQQKDILEALRSFSLKDFEFLQKTTNTEKHVVSSIDGSSDYLRH